MQVQEAIFEVDYYMIITTPTQNNDTHEIIDKMEGG